MSNGRIRRKKLKKHAKAMADFMTSLDAMIDKMPFGASIQEGMTHTATYGFWQGVHRDL